MNDIPALIVVGPAGAGKSRFAQHLLQQAAQPDCALHLHDDAGMRLDEALFIAGPLGLRLIAPGALMAAPDPLRLARENVPPRFRSLVVEAAAESEVEVLARALARPGFSPAGIVFLIDAARAEAELMASERLRRQAALADRLFLTRADEAGAPAVAGAMRLLKLINPQALPETEWPDARECLALFRHRVDLALKRRRLESWQAQGQMLPGMARAANDVAEDTLSARQTEILPPCLELTAPDPLDGLAVEDWLARLLHAPEATADSSGFLQPRAKGYACFAGEDMPVVLQLASGRLSRPYLLQLWPERRVGTRLLLQGPVAWLAAAEESFGALAGPLVSSRRLR